MILMKQLASAFVAFVSVAALALSAEPPALLDGNMVGNPSFEYDWHNNGAEGHILAFRGDWSFNASDLKPDYWPLPDNAKWVSDAAHTGTHSLLLSGGAITRTYPFAVSSAGGGGWTGPTVTPMTAAQPTRLARTLRAALWYKSANLGGGNTLALEIQAYGLVGKAVAEAPAPNWTRLEAVLPREEIEKLYAEGKAKDLPGQIALTITVAGAAQVWIDDVSFAEDLAADPNLAVNGSFESFDKKTGYPAEWSQPMKYGWRPPQYYRWTDWYHWFREPRGPIVTTDLSARSGQRCLLMQVYPGDEVLVQGAPVVLNQKENGIVEIGAYVLLDRVKWIDLRAVDQDGKEVPCIHAYLGGQPPQDSVQTYPSNASTWTYVRKLFQGAVPLKSIRPQLCARGFNGNALDDMGTRPNCVQTGLAWWDDVRVIDRGATADELKARGVTPAKPVQEQPDSVMLASFDPGERLFGSNVATAVLTNPTKKAIDAELSLDVADSESALSPEIRGVKTVKATVPPGETRAVSLPYTITKLDGSWDRQGIMALKLKVGRASRSVTLGYNTWPVIVDVDFSKHYATPAENPQSVAFNFGLSADTVKRTKNVVIEIHARRGDALVDTIKVGDLSKAMADTLANLDSFPRVEFDAPGPVAWADKRNLVALKMDFAKLPVHKPDDPVRDHYLLIRGLDAAGKELFSDKSQCFGRIEQITETLPKITETTVREDGAVLINGQPVFILGGGGWPTSRYALKPAEIKRYGFNAARWVDINDTPKFWNEANLYCLETVTGLGMTQAQIQQWQAEGKLDGAITLASVYESGTALADAEALAQHREFGRLAREVGHRVSNFGGGGAHNLYSLENVFDFYSSFGVELEPFGPPRGGYELAPILRKGSVAWFHLPQAYDPEPFEQFRQDQYAMILQGGRGFSIIQGLGDPSLYRGITGEMRHISPAIFSPDKGDERTAVPPGLHWMQRRVGNASTLIVGSYPPVEIGDWTWRTDNVASGQRAHTGVSAFKPYRTPDGLRLHAYRQDKPIVIQPGDVLVQQAWLDPKAPPSSLAWGPRGDGKWDFNGRYGKDFDFAKWKAEHVNYWAAGELLPGTWQITTDANNPWWAEHILTAKAFPASGALPKPGQWTRLELTAEQLGLVGRQIDGFMFLAKDGEVWWDHTALVRGGQDIVLCEDTVGLPREALKAVHVQVPWAPDGTKVKVLFEERDLIVKGGEFVDDFTGTDVYGAVRDAAVGDAEGWFPPGTPLYAQTLGYTTPNAPPEVHVYEIVPGAK